MKKSIRTVILTLVVGSLSIAATRLVAMRVDIEPLGASGDGTLVEVGLQIAPEDRPLLGQHAVLQIDLTHADETVDRVARSVDLDSTGRARIEVVWPPGVYEVRVEVGSADGEQSGFWLGKIRVPRFEPEPTVVPSAAAPVAGAVGGAAAAGSAPPPPRPPEPESRLGPSTEETPVATSSTVPTVVPWSDDPGMADLSVLVTVRNRPVSGLDAADLDLRVNGNRTVIESLGSAADTPLFLGVAIDASAPMAAQMPEMSRTLSGLAVRTLASGGELFVATAGPDATVAFPWGATPSDLANALADAGTAPDAHVTGLIATALGEFEGRIGRKFLIVVTDGGRVTDKADWKELEPVVEGAGVPIFVLGVRAEPLNERTRRNLDLLTAATGGKSYFVQDSGVLGMTVDHMAELIGGSYAVRYRRPTGEGLQKISISTDNKAQTVLHPSTVR